MIETPSNVDVERSALGGMILDPTTIDETREFLAPEDFWREDHQHLCRTVYALREEGRSIDALTVAERLRADNRLERVGGIEAVAGILADTPHAACTVEHAWIVRNYAVRRDLVAFAQATITEAMSPDVEAESAVGSAESRLFAVSDARVRHVSTLASDAAAEALVRLRRKSEHGVEGFPTGLIDLDDMLGGLRPGQLVVVGARPSMGKTAFALGLAESAVETAKQPVLFVSLEMSSAGIADRLLTMRSRVTGSKIQTGLHLTAEDWTALESAVEDLRSLPPIVIDDSPVRTASQILAHARRVKSRIGLACVVVDYLQLVEPDAPKEARQEQIAKIARRLKQAARELRVPVVALSQLNRAVESREDRRPRMTDLRESGAIEQDADSVILLHRPEYYDPNDQPGTAELIVAKNRDGATGTVRTAFLKAVTRFESLADETVF